MSNFIQDCLVGDALPDEIDDYIDQWHDGDFEIPLHAYLGMSWDEYAIWIESPNSLVYIVAARKFNISYLEAVSSAATMAARSLSMSKLPEIERWLDEKGIDR
ncbi:hypothetical protein [Spirosoma luteum]|uniref:hypothetical protein n=1 Tax=Spirosoma luteum TaxID=431553 RepID=UPI00036E6E09|nr:hypothetical protein [Spirosoma luteum]